MLINLLRTVKVILTTITALYTPRKFRSSKINTWGLKPSLLTIGILSIPKVYVRFRRRPRWEWKRKRKKSDPSHFTSALPFECRPFYSHLRVHIGACQAKKCPPIRIWQGETRHDHNRVLWAGTSFWSKMASRSTITALAWLRKNLSVAVVKWKVQETQVGGPWRVLSEDESLRA